jgi:mRNA-degrading endonuclease toxin of MazEF toxin-antitoxin module
VTRGDRVTVALQGDQGKPRPALVVQLDDATMMTVNRALAVFPGLA